MERRLTAIFAADMVGYSRLMEADEEGTIARQKAQLDGLIEPTIARHNGRIVKTMGDGLLVEFASIVEAVRCAIASDDTVAALQASQTIKNSGTDSRNVDLVRQRLIERGYLAPNE